MKRIVSIFICAILFSLIGCNKSENDKITSNFYDNRENDKIEIYSDTNSKEVKDLLKSYGKSKNLTVEKAGKRNIVVIENEKFVKNENLWNDFYENIKNKKEDSILILQYTQQNDPILTYLSYKDDKFFMIEDDSRDQYRESKESDYYEYTFKYLKMFEENNKVYVYLLDDDEITLDKLNYSLLSSKVSEWIPYGFVFYYSKI